LLIFLRLFLFFSIPIDDLPNILGFVSEDIGRFILILPELIGMRSKVLINDGIKAGIPRRSLHPPSADYAFIFLADHQLSQTGPAEPVITRLDADRKDHYLEAVAAGYLLF
jgi:hypothetical protein